MRKRSDIENVVDAMLPNGIELSEARGQRELVNAAVLPTQMQRWSGDGGDPKVVLEAAGVKFLGVIDDDPIFQSVELPTGWKKVPTDHSMWSKLVDDKGRERASIFYKAAFYDRSAHLGLTSRFNIRKDYDAQEKRKEIVIQVTDCGAVIHSISAPVPAQKPWEADEEVRRQAAAWLTENYPDWQNPGAYWS